jgi:O-phosphoseryl-tRNA(Cys) synthetase
MDAFLSYVSSELELLAEQGFSGTKEFRLGMVKRLSDINVSIPEEVRTFIQMKNNKIDVRGPVFFTIEVTVE